MKWTSALAIYFIIWWTVLFAVLPFGVRNTHETGEHLPEGHDAGAPVSHGLAWKAKVTTLIAFVVFAIVYVAIAFGGLDRLTNALMPEFAL